MSAARAATCLLFLAFAAKATENTTATTSTATTTTTTTMTEEHSTGIVVGNLSFVVTNGSASDLVDAFENETDGAVESALAASIAAGADGVSEDNVTITSVEVTLAQSERVVVEFAIAESTIADEVAAALTSDEGKSAIETSLTVELQAIDPSLTVADIEVGAVVTTATTTGNEVVNFAARCYAWQGSLVLACGLGSMLLH